MKEFLIKQLQQFLGYEFYLTCFSIFKIKTLFLDSRKSDYLYFNKMLPSNANIIIAGACTGITTAPFLINYPQRNAFAFEPIRSNYKVLLKILRFYKLNNITSFCFALGDKNEVRKMIIPMIDGARKYGMAHLVDESITEYNHGIIESIETKRIDDVIELNDVPFHAMKLVAENFEYEILKGAQSFITKNKPFIYCELWHHHKRQKVMDLIRSFNYEIYFRKNHELILYSAQSDYAGKHFFFKAKYE